MTVKGELGSRVGPHLTAAGFFCPAWLSLAGRRTSMRLYSAPRLLGVVRGLGVFFFRFGSDSGGCVRGH